MMMRSKQSLPGKPRRVGWARALSKMALFAGTLAIALGVNGAVARASSRQVASTAPEIYLEYFTITYHSTLTIQTSGSSVGADPVLTCCATTATEPSPR